MNTVKLLHDITQSGYEVQFSDDFEYGVSITFTTMGGEYIRHEHINAFNKSFETLESRVNESLNGFLIELAEDGEPRKDGLADAVNKP